MSQKQTQIFDLTNKHYQCLQRVQVEKSFCSIFFCTLMVVNTHTRTQKEKATCIFGCQNAMRACYWKHTFFHWALQSLFLQVSAMVPPSLNGFSILFFFILFCFVFSFLFFCFVYFFHVPEEAAVVVFLWVCPRVSKRIQPLWKLEILRYKVLSRLSYHSLHKPPEIVGITE